MYKFKEGEIYKCVKSTNENIFKVGNYYQVSTDYFKRPCLYGDNGGTFTELFFNNIGGKWVKIEKVENFKRDESLTIEVDTLLNMLAVNEYSVNELKAYLKGYKDGKNECVHNYIQQNK